MAEPLSMSGHISGGFDSRFGIIYVPRSVSYADGVPVASTRRGTPFVATVQPLCPKEIEALAIGADRIRDYRKLYINSGNMSVLERLDGRFEFLGEKWRPIEVDYRPTRRYCRVIVARIDT